MAEPPKPKRPSPAKKDPEPDFSSFEDWLIDGTAGKWPMPWNKEKVLSDRQNQIVSANAALLSDREVWRRKVDAFEAAVAALPDEEKRKRARAMYCIHFDRHRFLSGEKDFRRFHFPCSVSFAGARFRDGDISFIEVQFADGDVRFDGTTFGSGELWFAKTIFGNGTVSFDETVFGDGIVNFSGAVFGNGSVWFHGATFGNGNVLFDGANFGTGTISFDNVKFDNGAVSFDNVIFGDGSILFDCTQFGTGTVSFDGTSFGNGDVFFVGTNFGNGDVLFDGARFGDGTVSLANATSFSGNVRFDDLEFRHTMLSAPDMVIAGNLYVKTNFLDEVDFSRLDVKGTASFSGSRFDKVPDFRDAKFDRPPEVAGMMVPRPQLEGRSQRAVDQNDVAKFRKLKAMALAANDHEKDGEFFAGEMLAKRGTETTGRAGLVFNWLYWKLSDFGQGFMLPVRWMVRAFLVFAVGNVAVVSIGMPVTLASISSRVEAMAFATVLSLKNVIPLLGSLVRFAPGPEGHKGWFQTFYDTLKAHPATVDWLIGLGVVENITGTVLLFLLLLALRNKFRLK